MLQPNRCISQKTYYFSGTKTFWVIQKNSLPLEFISKINKRKNSTQISTFDFSTLYTKIPHDKQLDILYKVVDFVFKGGREAIKFVLHNCFFSIGNIIMIQVIGISMGSDPAPNLFLAHKEAD